MDLGPSADDLTASDIAARRVVRSSAAVQRSPFIDASLAGLWLEDRFGDPLVFGLQGGAYLGGVVRVAVRLEMPSKSSTDAFSGSYDNDFNFVARRSASATLIYGGSVGVVAGSSESFVFSPGLLFLRSDVADYGNLLAVTLPFEWVTTKGLRFGLDVALGRAFGGTVHYQCLNAQTDCSSPASLDRERPAGRAINIRFTMGFGFNHAR
jgi:hypothetical protein